MPLMQKLFIFIKKFKIVDKILYCIWLLICVKSVVLMFEYNFFFFPSILYCSWHLNILTFLCHWKFCKLNSFMWQKIKKKDKKKLKEKRNENWNLKRPVTLCIFTKQFFSLNENMRNSRLETKLKNIKKYYYCVNGSWRLLNRLPVKSTPFIVTIDGRAEVFIDICNRHNSMFTQNWKISPVEIKKRASN